MSQEREDAPRGQRSGNPGAWREFVSSVVLVAAVGAILATGFVLKTDRPGGQGDAEAEGAAPPVILLGSTITPEPRPELSTPAEPAARDTPQVGSLPSPPQLAQADPIFEKLARRAAADVARLEGVKVPWTAQLLVACRVETVDRVLATSKGAAKLYVVPAEVHGDACFRICWGSYRSRKDAAAAADLPKSLRGRESIAAVEIAKVLR